MVGFTEPDRQLEAADDLAAADVMPAMSKSRALPIDPFLPPQR